MELHQLQVTYQTDEDRILLRVSFRADDGAMEEIRAWITRRALTSLWPGIIRSLDSQVKMTKPAAAHASTEILSMEYQASVSEIKNSGNFDIPFQAEAQRYPLGEAPLLITTLKFHLEAGKPVGISFYQSNRKGFDVNFTQKAVHGFCKLLMEAARVAEWDLNLQMPSFAAQTEAAAAPRRLLN